MPEKHVIIVAGGSGSRMGSTVPKQFLEIGNRPILMRTLEVFAAYDPAMPIILVLPESHISLWNRLCEELGFKIPHKVVKGGQSRFQSVRNGLAQLPGNGLVAIHDGVRPFITAPVIAAGFETASRLGNAVVALPLKESIREVVPAAGSSIARDRSLFRLIQTPQTFDIQLIKEAYKQPESPLFTDDASVVESAGATIQLIEGSEANIKITHKTDLLVAEVLLKNEKSPM